MPKFINTFTWNQAPNDEFLSLLDAEVENAKELMEQGRIQYLFLAEDDSGGWVIYDANSKEEVFGILEQLPMGKFMNHEVKQLQNAFSAAEPAD